MTGQLQGRRDRETLVTQRTLAATSNDTAPFVGFQRLGAWAGLGFAAAMVIWIAVVVSGPTFVESGTALREFFDAGGDTRIRIGGWVIGAAYLFLLLPFVVALGQVLETPPSGWGRLAALGAVIAILVSLIEITLGDVIALSGIEGFTDPALETVWTAGRVLIVWLFHLATGMWVAAAGIGILKNKALPPWLGWLGVGLILPQVIAATWLLGGTMNDLHDAAGGIGQIGAFLIWIPAVAIAMLRQRTHKADPQNS